MIRSVCSSGKAKPNRMTFCLPVNGASESFLIWMVCTAWEIESTLLSTGGSVPWTRMNLVASTLTSIAMSETILLKVRNDIFLLHFHKYFYFNSGIFSSPILTSLSSNIQITLKFCINVTHYKILTHTKTWNNDLIFDYDDVKILTIFTANLCDWFYQYSINILFVMHK